MNGSIEGCLFETEVPQKIFQSAALTSFILCSCVLVVGRNMHALQISSALKWSVFSVTRCAILSPSKSPTCYCFEVSVKGGLPSDIYCLTYVLSIYNCWCIIEAIHNHILELPHFLCHLNIQMQGAWLFLVQSLPIKKLIVLLISPGSMWGELNAGNTLWCVTCSHRLW